MVSLVLFYSCSTNDNNGDDRFDFGIVENQFINEASGIDAGQLNQNVLWTHNDSGDENRIFALDIGGRNLATYQIAGATARDWEDIAIGPGPIQGQSYIYIGDIGDNAANFEYKYIYRFKEPKINYNNFPMDSTITEIDIIKIKYPDGMRDAEALLIDPLTNDLIIISKREENVRVYLIPYPQNTDETNVPEIVASINISQVTAGDISSSGNHVIIKNYDAIYYWHRKEGQSLSEIFQIPPINLPYVPEPQGEALCWSEDEKGYFTLSEEPNGEEARLYFYSFEDHE